jgi:hypothetical protein
MPGMSVRVRSNRAGGPLAPTRRRKPRSCLPPARPCWRPGAFPPCAGAFSRRLLPSPGSPGPASLAGDAP